MKTAPGIVNLYSSLIKREETHDDLSSAFQPTRRALLKGGGAVAAGLAFLPRFALAEEEKKLNLYNWDTYIGENTLADFQKATGIEAKMDLFADNDELFAKLKSGNPGYDVIVPTNDNLERMIKANMVHAARPREDPQHGQYRQGVPGCGLRSGPQIFDPLHVGHARHRLPQVEGRGRRRRQLEDPARLRQVFRHAFRCSAMPRTSSAAALKYLGYSFNSTDAAELKKAEDLLIAQKKHIKVFADDNGQDLLASGEVDACMEWNGDIIQVMAEDADLDYVVPTEGSLLWQDTLAIPTGAPHPGECPRLHQFRARCGSRQAHRRDHQIRHPQCRGRRP